MEPVSTSTRSSQSNSNSQNELHKNGSESNTIAVVGGGVMGICTAYYILQLLEQTSDSHFQVVLIECEPKIATAASGKAGGFLTRNWLDHQPTGQMAQRSFDMHVHLATKVFDGAKEYDYRMLRTLRASFHNDGSQDTNCENASQSHRSPTKRKHQFPVTEMRKQLNLNWVTGNVTQASYFGVQNETAQITPAKFCRALLNAAVCKGLQVYYGRRVVDVKIKDALVTHLILSDDFCLSVDRVAFCLGPWSGQLVRNFPCLRSCEFSSTKAHSIVLKPNNPLVLPITDATALFTQYVLQNGRLIDPEIYPRSSGEVYLCGTTVEASLPQSASEVFPENAEIDALVETAHGISEVLKNDFHIARRQACFLSCTADNIPVIGAVSECNNAFINGGASCWGILLSPAAGLLCAELMLFGVSKQVNASPFTISRFTSLPAHDNSRIKSPKYDDVDVYDQLFQPGLIFRNMNAPASINASAAATIMNAGTSEDFAPVDSQSAIISGQATLFSQNLLPVSNFSLPDVSASNNSFTDSNSSLPLMPDYQHYSESYVAEQNPINVGLKRTAQELDAANIYSSHSKQAPVVKPRQRVKKQACQQCYLSHVTCDGERPCKRCTKHGRPNECTERSINRRLMRAAQDSNASMSRLSTARSKTHASTPTVFDNAHRGVASITNEEPNAFSNINTQDAPLLTMLTSAVEYSKNLTPNVEQRALLAAAAANAAGAPLSNQYSGSDVYARPISGADTQNRDLAQFGVDSMCIPPDQTSYTQYSTRFLPRSTLRD